MNQSMNKRSFLPFILWPLYTVYLYLFYHIIVIPFSLDFWVLGVALIIVLSLIMIFAIPKKLRKSIIVFSLLLLLADKAVFNIGILDGLSYYLSFAVILIGIALIAKWYGKLSVTPITVLLIASILVSFIPRDHAPLYAHFTIKWKSPALYISDTIDYFPYVLKDIDQDGQDEIVTIGNAFEEKSIIEQQNQETNESSNKETDPSLKPDQLNYYVFKWNGTEMERVMEPTQKLLTNEVINVFQKDYPGFPFLSLNDSQLNPLIDRDELAESMLQFGAAPYQAMALNIENLNHYLTTTDGVWDAKEEIINYPAFRDIKIKNGMITGYYNENKFELKTTASKIVGGIQLPNKIEGLLLQGNSLDVLTFTPEPKLAYTLTQQQISDITTAELIISDVDFDQVDEILLSFPTNSSNASMIIKPKTAEKWELIWKAKDKSFRFEDIIRHNDQNGKMSEIIVLDKSHIGLQPIRYLSSYNYDTHALKRNWKVFQSVINVRSGDVDGDGKQELVSSLYGTHQILILQPHSIPVTMIIIGLTMLLITFGLYRRIRYEK